MFYAIIRNNDGMYQASHWHSLSSSLVVGCQASMMNVLHVTQVSISILIVCVGVFVSLSKTYEPRREKTDLQGFRPGPTQTGLCNYTR